MNVPFDISCDYAGTAVVKKLFDNTDNPLVPNTTAELVVPTKPFYLNSLSVTSNKAVKAEFGYVTGGGTFTPVYPTQGTDAVAGGIVRTFATGPLIPHDGSTLFAAVRISAATNPTNGININGDVEWSPKASASVV